MVLAARGEMVVLADPVCQVEALDPGVVVAASSVPRRNADIHQRPSR